MKDIRKEIETKAEENSPADLYSRTVMMDFPNVNETTVYSPSGRGYKILFEPKDGGLWDAFCSDTGIIVAEDVTAEKAIQRALVYSSRVEGY